MSCCIIDIEILKAQFANVQLKAHKV